MQASRFRWASSPPAFVVDIVPDHDKWSLTMRKLLLFTVLAVLTTMTQPARAQFCPGAAPWVFDDVPASDRSAATSRGRRRTASRWGARSSTRTIGCIAPTTR